MKIEVEYMNKIFGGQIYQAFAKTKQKDVMIGIKPHLQWELKREIRDKEGRYIIIQGLMQGENTVLVNIYASNKKIKQFFHKSIQIMDKIIEGDNLIIMGDFNSVVHSQKDRSRAIFIGKFPTNIRKRLKHHQMVDSWKFSKGDESQYTYYSNRFSSYSRIDYIWVSEKIAIRNSRGTIEIKAYSDHAAITIDWEVGGKKTYCPL